MADQLCAHCHYRPVRDAPRNPSRARYCSDRCRIEAQHRSEHDRRRDHINQLRAMLGLPAGTETLSSAELRRIIAVLGEKLDLNTIRRRGRRRVLGDHGTQKRYKQGCSCAPCRAAETAYRRDLRARRKVDKTHDCPQVIHCQSDLSPLATPQADRQSWDDPTPESQVA